MQCNAVPARLSAFVDGELSKAAGWRVRRHLHTCPNCAALFADLEQVSLSARNLHTEKTVPASLRTRFLSAAAQAPEAIPEAIPARPFRREGSARRIGRAVVLASAVVGLIGISAGGVSLYLSAQPTAAYAEIERAMLAQPFRTVHMRGLTVITDDSLPGGTLIRTNDFWGRMDIPAGVFTTQCISNDIHSHIHTRHRAHDIEHNPHTPVRMTQTVKGGVVRFLDGSPRKVFGAKYLARTPKALRKWLINHSFNDEYGEVPQTGADASWESESGMHWQSSMVVLNGRCLLRLEGGKGAWYLGRNSFESTVLYADPQTHLVVRIEHTWHWSGTEFYDLWRDIRYNETPPKGLFQDAL